MSKNKITSTIACIANNIVYARGLVILPEACAREKAYSKNINENITREHPSLREVKKDKKRQTVSPSKQSLRS
jgi:hypothetical protein